MIRGLLELKYYFKIKKIRIVVVELITMGKLSLMQVTVETRLHPLWKAGGILHKQWHDIIFRFRRAYKDTDTGVVEVYGRDGLVLRYQVLKGGRVILL